jgi:hypothetical protein
LFLIGLPQPVVASERAGQVTLLFFARDGAPLSPAEVRALSNNGKAGYNNDLLVDPVTLRGIAAAPLRESGNSLVFDVSGRPMALALNWPTLPRGYSLILLDNGGRGFTAPATVNFTYQAAKDLRRKLDAALRARRGYRRSPGFDAAYRAARAHLAVADGATDSAVRGKEGQLALDQLAVAYDLLLSEHGPLAARGRLRRLQPWLGLTIDTVEGYRANLGLVAGLTRPFGWIRIVFDAGTEPAEYRETVTYAHSLGLKILGQPVDSSYDKRFSRAEYLRRFDQLMGAFPEIEAWEVGNEVNGDWLTPEIPLKVADAAAACRAHGRLAVLTLFWQLNTGAIRNSLFTWIDANLPAAVRKNLDVVLLSIYPEQAPLGVFFDQLMTRMRAEFPSGKLGIGELGYWIPDQQFWWAYDREDPNGAARHAVAAQYYNAALDFPGSIGGCFWWNTLREFPRDPAMQSIVRAVRDALR